MPARLKLFLPLILFGVMALFLLRGLELDPRELPSALIDQPLPEFSLTALGSGEALNREAVTGQVALFNVWATWCPTCKAEHAELMEIAASTDVMLVGVNYKDDAAKARRWLSDYGDPYDLVIVDPDRPSLVESSDLLCKCHWSPFEGHEFSSTIDTTIVNGEVVYANGRLTRKIAGRRLEFSRER